MEAERSAAAKKRPTRIPMGGMDKCLLCRWQGRPDEPHGCPRYMDRNGPVAGRFVLFEPTEDGDAYVTSWDTWEECEVAFPLGHSHVLRDEETGREWREGFAYEWEAAQT